MFKTLKLFLFTAIFLSGTFLSLHGQNSKGWLSNNSIKEALNQPMGNLFFIERINGKYRMGDTVSHFNSNKNFEALTFDISNNKVLANVGVQGTLKALTLYRDSYFANCSPSSEISDSWPGVWVAKDNSSYGPYSFRIETGGESFDLDNVDWDFRTGYLDNIIPITEFKGAGGKFTAKVVTYAPVSSDGNERIRGAVYGLYLENNADEKLTGTVHLPKLMKTVRKRINLLWTDSMSWAALDPYDYEMGLGDSEKSTTSVSFSLGKGENLWVPVVFNNLGDDALQLINSRGTLGWLNQTGHYFRKMLGNLQTPDDPYLADFFERQVLAAFGSIAMAPSGKIAGSNWGSYPATRQIWMKDFYYTSLPFMMLDKELAKKIILWFNEFGVRPKGNIKEGGVNHSVGISMASIMLSGFYYEYSGDAGFFSGNPQLKQNWDKILEELIVSRKDTGIWLFPSRYISDGYILPDYHTGSNVCAWFAFKSYARLLRNVYHEPEKAASFENLAVKVKEAILGRCTINGPYGKQFIEATYRDGREAPMESDGEESDITLMPLYGFLTWDDPVYLNYMRFSMSEHNTIYSPKLHAIKWYDVPSTAPGYMKGICAGTNKNSLFGEHGFLTEVRKITDADGSIWWWTYGWGTKNETPAYGNVVRGNLGGFGKAGWFSGVYASVFISRFLGLSYSKDENALGFMPFMPSGGYEWKNVPFLEKDVTVTYWFDGFSELFRMKMNSLDGMNYRVHIPFPEKTKQPRVFINGSANRSFVNKKHLNKDYIQADIINNTRNPLEVVVTAKSSLPKGMVKRTN